MELLESRATNVIMEALLNRARLAESMRQLSETYDAICCPQRPWRFEGHTAPIHGFIGLAAAIKAERVARATAWQFVNRLASRRNPVPGWQWRKSDAFGAVLAESPRFDLFQDCFAHAQEHGFRSGLGPANFETE